MLFVIHHGSTKMSHAFFLLTLVLCTIPTSCQGAVLRSSSRNPGNLTIGFIVPGHLSTSDDAKQCCGSLINGHALLVAVFGRLVDEVNKANFLPAGMRLGYEVVDSCSSESYATSQVLDWVMQRVRGLPNTPPLAFVLGAGLSRISQTVAPLLEKFGIPQIDYSATSTALSDRRRFKLYARTSPSDRFMAKGMVDLVSYLRWKCVHLVYSRGDYGENGAEAVAQYLLNASICLAGGKAMPLPLDQSTTTPFNHVVAKIRESRNIRPIICFCEDGTIRGLLQALKDNSKIEEINRPFIIAGDFWGTEINLEDLQGTASGALTFHTNATIAKAYSQTFKNPSDFLKRIVVNDPSNVDPWLKELVENTNRCRLGGGIDDSIIPRCNANSTSFRESDLPPSDNVALFTNAFLAGVSGLKSFLEQRCARNQSSCKTFSASDFTAKEGYGLYNQILSAKFPLDGDKEFSFFQRGDGYPIYEINRYSGEYRGSSQNYFYKRAGIWEWRSGLAMQLTDDVLNGYMAKRGADSCTNALCSVNCTSASVISTNDELESTYAESFQGSCFAHIPDSPPSAISVENQSSQGTDFFILPLVAVILSVVIIVLIAVIAIMVTRKSKSKTPETAETSSKKYVDYILSSCSFNENERSEFRELFESALIDDGKLLVTSECIGRGSNGVVYKGLLQVHKMYSEQVAIKQLRSSTPSEIVDFVREGSMMHLLNHPNVLRLIGLSVSPAEDVLKIIVPFMPNGDLRTFLIQNGRALSEIERINFMMQICYGMEYLASKNCIHRDLACRNILIQRLPYMILLKVADFGLARQLNESDYYMASDKNRPIPLRWWPPESLQGSLIFEERSDVWSFGICCFEIYSNGQRPYHQMDNASVLDFVVNKSGYPSRPLDCRPAIYEDVMKRCWKRHRLTRPRFSELTVKLQNIERLSVSAADNESTDTKKQADSVFSESEISGITSPAMYF